jgi:hypothetical protein
MLFNAIATRIYDVKMDTAKRKNDENMREHQLT